MEGEAGKRKREGLLLLFELLHTMSLPLSSGKGSDLTACIKVYRTKVYRTTKKNQSQSLSPLVYPPAGSPNLTYRPEESEEHAARPARPQTSAFSFGSRGARTTAGRGGAGDGLPFSRVGQGACC